MVDTVDFCAVFCVDSNMAGADRHFPGVCPLLCEGRCIFACDHTVIIAGFATCIRPRVTYRAFPHIYCLPRTDSGAKVMTLVTFTEFQAFSACTAGKIYSGPAIADRTPPTSPQVPVGGYFKEDVAQRRQSLGHGSRTQQHEP